MGKNWYTLKNIHLCLPSFKMEQKFNTLYRVHNNLYKALSQNRIHWAPAPPHPSKVYVYNTYMYVFIERLGQVAGAIWAQAPILGRHVSACATILGCMRYYIRLRALLYQVACATILRLRTILACVTLGHALLYCTSIQAAAYLAYA